MKSKDTDLYIEKMVDGYLSCASWAHELDNEVFSVDALNVAYDECKKFVLLANNTLDDVSPEDCGHTLYLTSNGCGVSFLDRNYKHKTFLNKLATEVGREMMPYLSDDGFLNFLF